MSSCSNWSRSFSSGFEEIISGVQGTLVFLRIVVLRSSTIPASLSSLSMLLKSSSKDSKSSVVSLISTGLFLIMMGLLLLMLDIKEEESDEGDLFSRTAEALENLALLLL